MNKDQQRIAIAKAHGFTVRFNESKDAHELLTPQGTWEYPYDADGDEAHCWSYVPDYLSDLNAMHEAEKLLIEKACMMTYQLELFRVTNPEPRWRNPEPIHVQNWLSRNFITATASQRAEAFLRTLNLWTDNDE